MGGVIPSEDAWGRTARTVRRDEARYADPTKKGEHRLRFGAECTPKNEVWKIKITGVPTGGDFDLSVTAGGTTSTITINFDDTAAEVKTAFATHANLTTADIDTAGGPLPSAEISVEFIGDFAKKLMFNSADNAPLVSDDSTLTGGTSPAAWVIPLHGGYPGDGYS